MASNDTESPDLKQQFDYFLVLDFEATCDNKEKLHPQEIIEFPVLKVNGTTFETESIFHQYVQPRVFRELTPFCTELTGIVQEMVDGQPHIEETLVNFHEWMKNENLLCEDTSSAFVTCGDWDLKTMLPKQCDYFHIAYPKYLKRWINIKKSYAEAMKKWPRGMMYMLNELGITHQGRHHSGIDDCHNISEILKRLAEMGHIYRYTSTEH